MEQHAIPQNVSSYQFRLVGDMTIKQFVELAGGILLAWLSISSSLPTFVRWPLGIGVAFFGFALAFIPVEERPLEVWIKNFFVSIYRPTLYLWKKDKPSVKTTVAPSIIPAKAKTDDTQSKAKLNAYLKTIKKPTTPSTLDQAEQKRLNSVENVLFNLNQLQKIKAKPISSPLPKPGPVETPDQPNFSGVRVRKLHPQQAIQKHQVLFKTPPAPPASVNIKPQPGTASPMAKKTKPIVLQSQQPQGLRPVPVMQAPPLAPPLKVRSLHPDEPAKKAPYSKTLQMPIKPDRPNLLAGMIKTPEHKPIDGAILEIKNNRNETVRALKTNKLGQFFTATPLSSSQYRLYVEHPEWNFDIIELQMTGKILPPLEIVASRKASP
jgi:hypothetical protein